ncbi:MAG: hypothetical protein ACFFAO_19035 [Candidatus Hermodarchaeota archaeon]
MAKKKDITSSKIHGLVIFKGALIKDETDESTYSFEEVDQENKILLKHELAPFGTSYRYSILLVNESRAPIAEIKVGIKYPNFLSLTRTNPATIEIDSSGKEEKKLKKLNFELEKISETSKTQINFYFVPLTLKNKGTFSTYVTYVNNKDFVRVLNSDQIPLSIEPVVIQPKIMESSKIGEFLKTEGIKKAIKSFGLDGKEPIDFNLIFTHIEKMLTLNKFHLVAKDENKKIVWFFGIDKKKQDDILVVGQINSNKIEFLATSQNHTLLISLLTNLTEDFKKHLMSAKLIDSLDQLYSLECKYCGGILDRFPTKGESISCPNCKKEQTVW